MKTFSDYMKTISRQINFYNNISEHSEGDCMKTTAQKAFRRPSAPISLAILTLLAGMNAHAQTAAPVAGTPASGVASSDSTVIPEVVVTGTKRSTPLQRTPIAITALSAATLQDNHVQFNIFPCPVIHGKS